MCKGFEPSVAQYHMGTFKVVQCLLQMWANLDQVNISKLAVLNFPESDSRLKAKGGQLQLGRPHTGSKSNLGYSGARRLKFGPWIYIYIYIWSRVPCSYPPMVWVPRSLLFGTYWILLAACLKSSLVFAWILQRF